RLIAEESCRGCEAQYARLGLGSSWGAGRHESRDVLAAPEPEQILQPSGVAADAAIIATAAVADPAAIPLATTLNCLSLRSGERREKTGRTFLCRHRGKRNADSQGKHASRANGGELSHGGHLPENVTVMSKKRHFGEIRLPPHLSAVAVVMNQRGWPRSAYGE